MEVKMLTPELRRAGWREMPSDDVREKWISAGGWWQICGDGWMALAYPGLAPTKMVWSDHPWRPVNPQTWDYNPLGWRDASTPEPPPKPEGELVTPPLIAWLEARGHAAAAQLVRERDAYGRAKYGQGLMTGDGRDTIEDLRQELGDAMQYAWKARMQGLNLASVDTLVGVLRSIVSAWDGAAIAIDIMMELARADAKYGREENLPDVEPVLMNRPGGCTAQRMAEEYEIPTRWRAQMMCEQSKRASHLTSAHLVIEELCEAVEAATIAPEELRAELVQVGAMVVKWIRNIDRRDGR